MKKLLISVIKLYQKTLSPDHGWLRVFYPHGYCRFYPSCSEYCRQAISEYNIFKSLLMCLWRLIRCNPFSKGGIDKIK